MAPTLVFDKSFLQSLSVDEAAMLDQMFSCVVTPVFIVETLADLSKVTKGRAPERVVAELAEKTPVARSYMTTFHATLAEGELLGRRATMDFRPAITGGIPVRVEGKSGVVFEHAPEAEAFERWQAGAFLEVERRFAAEWRRGLGGLDLAKVADGYRALLRKDDRPKSHADARRLAASIVDAPARAYQALNMAAELLDIHAAGKRAISRAWKRAGSPPLREYAPFTTHCLEVDLYFILAMSNGIISDQRASNRVDVSYLCYLPFARVFVSQDKLHRAAAPHFLASGQHFLWGPDLKADLKRLNQLFSALPDEEKAKGLFLLASTPPRADEGLCATLWDAVSPGWRTPKESTALTKEQNDAILARSNRALTAARSGIRAPFPTDQSQLHQVVLRRHVPTVRGSWRMFSAEAERADDEEQKREHERSGAPVVG